jgi:hypothetical protein
MSRAFQFVQQFFDIVVAQTGRQTEFSWSDHKWLPNRQLRSHESEPDKAVHDLLEGGSGSAALLIEQPSDIVVE